MSDTENVVKDAEGNIVPYEKQTPFDCPCGYHGRIADLIIPDDDNDPLECPQCGGHSWEWGISEEEIVKWECPESFIDLANDVESNVE